MADTVVNVNEQKLKALLEIYKTNFWGKHWEDEKFKWEAVAEFQDKWNIEAEDFYSMFYNATVIASPNQGGLFDSGSVYPRINLKLMYETDSQGTRQLFKDLFNEENSLVSRVDKFLKNAEKIWVSTGKSKENHDQQYVVMTYLWLKYPDKYYIYKYSACYKLAKLIGSNYIPTKGAVESIINSQKFYDKISSIVKSDKQIIEILKKCDGEISFKNTDGEFAKKDYCKWLNTLVSDFAFYVKIRIGDINERKMKFKEWALKKGHAKGIKDATINGYIRALERMWQRSIIAGLRESPYDYSVDDIDEFELLKLKFGKQDSDSLLGFDWYLEFLKNPIIEGSNMKNLILYGPPGTGKTYNTVLKAMNIIAPEKHYDDSKYAEAKVEYDRYLDDGRIQFVTFHQSYSYEDFIEGIKAKTENGNVIYSVEDGVFKKFCDEARKHEGLSYVFIIDEINRGNISKIFGELITLIEETKREGEDEATSALLPYPDNNGNLVHFTVPSNVYIIGTMNTADRSLTVVDTALRRRFTFEEMLPKPEKLQGLVIDGIAIHTLLEVMNERITALYDREHTIGHAFFMKLNNSSKIEDLGAIFKNKIIPLLQEYFYDDYEKIRLVLGDNQKKNGEPQFINIEAKKINELFGYNSDLDIDSVNLYSINDKAFGQQKAYKYLGLEDAQFIGTEEKKDSDQ